MKITKILLSLLLVLNLFGCTSTTSRFNDQHLDFDPSDELHYYEDGIYYSQLNEYQQVIYKAIFHACLNGYESIDIGVDYRDDDLCKAKDALTYEWPQFYWFQDVIVYSYDDYITIEQQYVDDVASCIELNNEIYEMALKIVEECQADYQYDTIKNIHDYLIENVKYNYESEYSQDYRSVFLNGESVCAGFSYAFEYLCNLAGYQCICVTGDSLVENTEEEEYGFDGHEWNIVQLGGDYYYVDVTWDNFEDDDGNNEEPEYQYFLITEDILLIDHSLDDRYTYPECNMYDLYYYDEPGLYVSELDYSNLTNYVAYWLQNGYTEFCFKCADDYLAYDIRYWLFDEEGICDIYENYVSYNYDVSYGYEYDPDTNLLSMYCYSN